MPRVFLISANREFMPYPVFPLGLAYVESALAGSGHETAVFDANLYDPSQAENALANAVERFQPELIGVSVRNIDNLTYPISQSYLDDIRAMISACRKAAPLAPVVLGGAGYSLFPVKALEALGADAGVIGEAEGRIGAVARALISGQTPAEISGVVYREGQSVRQTRRPSSEDLVFPEKGPRRAGLDMGFYGREGGMGNVQSKRGCPFNCSYCTYPILEGRCFQTRPAGAVADEFAELADRHGIGYIYFTDNYFNFPTDHAESICGELIRRKIKVPWTCFAHPAHLGAELADLMRRAGCASVELGSDAGSPTMLAGLNKEMTPDQILAASRACREAGLPFAHYLLLGGPGESEDTLSETFDLMDRCEPTAVIVMCGIRIYPGTPIERRAREEGLLETDDGLLAPRFYLSPAIRDSLLDRVEREAASRSNWIVPGLHINISPRLMKWVRDHGHKGPAWELLEARRHPK